MKKLAGMQEDIKRAPHDAVMGQAYEKCYCGEKEKEDQFAGSRTM